MSYVRENFLLNNDIAEKLYFDFAAKEAIFDYHCHLSEKMILEDKPFEDIYEIWLSGDHYKWRLMRSYGVSEEYITGKKTHKEEFIKYCEVVSAAFGNPLQHWSQLEIEKYFKCNLTINKENASKIWDMCNDYIKRNKVSPSSLIKESNVKIIFTTNEIFDDLNIFKKLEEKNYPFKVIPAFRADKIMNIESKEYISILYKLGKISSLNDLEKTIEDRLLEFIKVGCKASDIALEKVELIAEKKIADGIFKKKISGKELENVEISSFKGYLTYFLLKLYAKYDIKCELHIGAKRNLNTKMFDLLGADSGFDCISEENSANNLALLLDRLRKEDSLTNIILFNLNPKMNNEFLSLMACFQDDSCKGKIQYGPAWWFLDNKKGIYNQLQDLSSQGHIATFIGMLTDSRSFLSYERHHYFRRILCSYFSDMIEKGEMSDDLNFVGEIIKDICYRNAVNYFKVL